MRGISMSELGPIAQAIKRKVTEALNPVKLEIYNDSAKHAHHASMRNSENTVESHFRLVVVSDKFEGKTLPARHRMIYQLLDGELKMANGVHALQLKTKTPQEFNK